MGGPLKVKSQQDAETMRRMGFNAEFEYGGNLGKDVGGMFNKATTEVNKSVEEWKKRTAPPPEMPDASDAAVRAARDRARARLANQGLRATFLTGARGVQGAPTLGKPTLLGS